VLERFWGKLHAAVPELGAGIEVIETANPRTYYELTRRKLGMVLGLEGPSEIREEFLPHVFMVGDTVVSEANMAAVVRAALRLSQRLLTQKRKDAN
jgi:hypothetical protein